MNRPTGYRAWHRWDGYDKGRDLNFYQMPV